MSKKPSIRQRMDTISRARRSVVAGGTGLLLVLVTGVVWLAARPVRSQVPLPLPPIEAGQIEALLRNPPRVPASLRVLLAREWARRLPAGDLAGFRETLLSLEGQFRAEGLLLADASSFESRNDARDREALRRVAGLNAGGDAATAETFDRWFLDRDRVDTRAAAARAIVLGRRRAAELRVEEETLALGIFLVTALAESDDVEARMEELLGPSERLYNERMAAARKAPEARLKAARDKLEIVKAQHSHRVATAEDLLAAKLAVRDANDAVTSAMLQVEVAWRDVIEAAGEDWDTLAQAAGVDPRFGDRPYDRRLEFLKPMFDGFDSPEDIRDPAWRAAQHAALAAIVDERAGVERSIAVYQASLAAGNGVEDHGGVAAAMRVGAAGLARLTRRETILRLVVAAQANATIDTEAIRAGLNAGEATWTQLVEWLGDDAGRVAPALLTHPLSSFDAETLADALDRSRNENERLVATTAEQVVALEAKLAQLGQRVSDSLVELRAGVEAEREDVQRVLTADRREASEPLRVEIAQDLMHDHGRIRAHIEALEADEIPEHYEMLSDEGRGGMLVALKRHERRQGEDDEVDDEDEQEAETDEERERLAKKKWGDRIEKAEGAVKAAEDVTDMLVHLGVVDASEVDGVLKGLDAANAGLTIATGLASGNVFDVISGTTQLVSILFGVEPPPTPEEIRHEQVMNALGALAEGQELIMQNLVVISKQIDALRQDVSDLYMLARSTHQLLIDEQLMGYRLAEDFLDTRRYYAVTRPDPLSGAPVTQPELGMASYASFIDHFQKHREKYVEGRLFLEDQAREKPLEILALAEDLDQAALLARMPKGWKNAQILPLQSRSKAVLAFVDAIVDPAKRSAVLGSLAHPATDHPTLVKKLELLAREDATAIAVWKNVYAGPNYERSLETLYNPILIAGLSSALGEFQTYRLLDLGAEATERMPRFDALVRPGADPSRAFGATPASRNQLLRAPLDNARRLLQQAMAQDALYQGDVIAALLGVLMLQDSVRFDHPAITTAEAAFATDPMLRHNALRFVTYLHLHHTPAESEAIVQDVLSLVRSEVRETATHPPVWRPASDDALRIAYPDLVKGPAPDPERRDFFPPFSPGRAVSTGTAMRDGGLYASWGQYMAALDLRVVASWDAADDKWGMPIPDARFGSEARVVWFMPDFTRLSDDATPGYQLRLPGADDAAAGLYLRTDIVPMLTRAMDDLDAAIREIEATYAGREPSEIDDQLLRESWLRELYTQTYHATSASGS